LYLLTSFTNNILGIFKKVGNRLTFTIRLDCDQVANAVDHICIQYGISSLPMRCARIVTQERKLTAGYCCGNGCFNDIYVIS
jgi:hypothetical protein